MSGTGTRPNTGTSGTYLAVWPVDPDMGLPAARQAATSDLHRLAELAGVVLTGPATFTVCAADSWHGPLGVPGDLLLVACAPARALPAAGAGAGPAPSGGSVAAEHLPADVTARERGRPELPARRDALARLRRAGHTDAQIACRAGLSTRTVQRLLAATR